MDIKIRRSYFPALLVLISLAFGQCKVNGGSTNVENKEEQTGSKEEQPGNKEIAFQDLRFDEARSEAAKTGKLIFMDAYAVWCGPCKKMNRDVFTDPEVAAYFNKNFINLRVDMEKGEGPDLVKKFDVQFYPTLLFIDENGKVVKKGIGYHSAHQLLELGKSFSRG